MPSILFESLLFNSRGDTKINSSVDPTNSKTHLQSCLRFASRFIKLRSPLKSTTSSIRQSTSFDILRDDVKRQNNVIINRAYSSPDFTQLLVDHSEDLVTSPLLQQQQQQPKQKNKDVYFPFVTSSSPSLYGIHTTTTAAAAAANNQLYISEKKAFLSQPYVFTNKEKSKHLKQEVDEEDSDIEEEEEEIMMKYAKPATAFLVSLSPSAAAAASAARYRRRRQVRVVSQGLVTLVS